MPIGSGPNIYRALAGPNDPANDARALLGQGVAMGWGDELEAAYRAYGPGAMQAFGATLTTPGAAPPPAYGKELAALGAKYAAYAKRNPGRAAGLEFAGSVLPFLAPAGAVVTGARGASRAGMAGKVALQEAGIGALYGAGKGESPTERAGGAVAGAIINGLVGGGTAAGLAYSPEIKALAKKYGPQVAAQYAPLLALTGLGVASSKKPTAAKKPAPRKPPAGK
jgi:hypothetical protein